MTAARLFRLAPLPLLALLAGHGYGQSAFEASLAELTSVSGQFVQEVREADGYLVDRQEGSFSLQRPRLLRWDVPAQDQLLISDGESIYLYDALFDQVTVRPWSSDPAVNPIALLLDDVYLADWAQVTEEGDEILIVPFGHQTNILQIRVRMEGNFPSSMTVGDTTGQVSEIYFIDVVHGVVIDPEQFQFQIPPGVEVIYSDGY